jgi:hypothetical protein
MKEIIKTTFSVIILSVVLLSCNKNQSPIIPIPTTYTPNHKTFVISEEEDSIQYTYTYDDLWRIVKLIRSVDGNEGEVINWLKNGNIVKKTSNKNPYIYSYYLNKKRFADSITVIYPGYVYLTEKISYSTEGLPTNKKISGTILSNPYEEYFSYEFSNGDLIKQTQTFEDQTFTNTYTYYTDSINFMAGTNEAMTFFPQSKHLLKSIVKEDHTFTEFLYGIVSQNEISIQSKDEQENISTKFIKISKIN